MPSRGELHCSAAALWGMQETFSCHPQTSLALLPLCGPLGEASVASMHDTCVSEVSRCWFGCSQKKWQTHAFGVLVSDFHCALFDPHWQTYHLCNTMRRGSPHTFWTFYTFAQWLTPGSQNRWWSIWPGWAPRSPRRSEKPSKRQIRYQIKVMCHFGGECWIDNVH